MISIYRPDETEFFRNGLGSITKYVIDPSVMQDLNGIYAFKFKYPIFAPRANYVKGEHIMKVMTPKGYQLFRIHKEEPVMGYRNVTAYHIFYDLAFNYIDDTNVVGKTGTAAGNQILGATNYLHSFEFVSDIATVANARMFYFSRFCKETIALLMSVFPRLVFYFSRFCKETIACGQ